ncbi:hypothetical protein QFC19_001797 [Naganishia cerealis]|uniref:Uncharacterized protein n=1 Tax=Naganishia cerealis TaxID=610337 RepID=A0ACC2WH16_9TREE|nr:hypothetical protein QFC19_001797 [Naganishia cerealis]
MAASSSLLSDSGDGLNTSDDEDNDDDDDEAHEVTDPEDDQCCCFTCGKKLGGWDETDDPYEEHWKRSSSAVAAEAFAVGEGKTGGKGKQQQVGEGEVACAWATAVCSAVVHVRQWKEAVVNAGQGETTVKGKTMGTGAKKRGGKITVSDWEPTDDPWKQHYDKSPKCPFFTETVEGEEEETEVGLAVGETVDAADVEEYFGGNKGTADDRGGGGEHGTTHVENDDDYCAQPDPEKN